MAFPKMLAQIAETMPTTSDNQGELEPFKFVAVAGQPGEGLEEPEVENLGLMSSDQWHQEVASRKMLVSDHIEKVLAALKGFLVG
jgi:hypothetical protein